jgi:hypothetical protein
MPPVSSAFHDLDHALFPWRFAESEQSDQTKVRQPSALSDPTHSRSCGSSSCCNLEVWLKMAECKMFGSPETDKASDFIALSDDALEEASGGGLPLFNSSTAPWLIWKGYLPLSLTPYDISATWLKVRDHSACNP